MQHLAITGDQISRELSERECILTGMCWTMMGTHCIAAYAVQHVMLWELGFRSYPLGSRSILPAPHVLAIGFGVLVPVLVSLVTSAIVRTANASVRWGVLGGILGALSALIAALIFAPITYEPMRAVTDHQVRIVVTLILFVQLAGAVATVVGAAGGKAYHEIAVRNFRERERYLARQRDQAVLGSR